jgi:excinuclease UvrABC helicase subunit UvrB
MTPTQELAQINTLIEDAKRDLRNGRYEARGTIKQLEKQMMEHARNLEFEKAAQVRDQLGILKAQAFGAPGGDKVVPLIRA